MSRVNADEIEGMEKQSKFHTFRFLLVAFTAYFAINWYVKKSDEPYKEPASLYGSLEEAIAGQLPRYGYAAVKIDDTIGPYDPVIKGKQMLGYVHDDADTLQLDGKDIGYIVHGVVYNAAGRKVARLTTGAVGYEIYSYDNKKLGTLTEKKLLNSSGAVLGTLGPKAAVVMDNGDNLTGIITGYDYSRKNL